MPRSSTGIDINAHSDVLASVQTGPGDAFPPTGHALQEKEDEEVVAVHEEGSSGRPSGHLGFTDHGDKTETTRGTGSIAAESAGARGSNDHMVLNEETWAAGEEHQMPEEERGDQGSEVFIGSMSPETETKNGFQVVSSGAMHANGGEGENGKPEAADVVAMTNGSGLADTAKYQENVVQSGLAGRKKTDSTMENSVRFFVADEHAGDVLMAHKTLREDARDPEHGYRDSAEEAENPPAATNSVVEGAVQFETDMTEKSVAADGGIVALRVRESVASVQFGNAKEDAARGSSLLSRPKSEEDKYSSSEDSKEGSGSLTPLLEETTPRLEDVMQRSAGSVLLPESTDQPLMAGTANNDGHRELKGRSHRAVCELEDYSGRSLESAGIKMQVGLGEGRQTTSSARSGARSKRHSDGGMEEMQLPYLTPAEAQELLGLARQYAEAEGRAAQGPGLNELAGKRRYDAGSGRPLWDSTVLRPGGETAEKGFHSKPRRTAQCGAATGPRVSSLPLQDQHSRPGSRANASDENMCGSRRRQCAFENPGSMPYPEILAASVGGRPGVARETLAEGESSRQSRRTRAMEYWATRVRPQTSARLIRSRGGIRPHSSAECVSGENSAVSLTRQELTAAHSAQFIHYRYNMNGSRGGSFGRGAFPHDI